MFKLGEYDDVTARDLTDRLRKMKVRVDIRPSIVADVNIKTVLQGRFSELKSEIEDETLIKRYEHYLEAVRKTFAEGPAPEEFYKKYLTHAVPEWVKLVEKIGALVMEKIRQEDVSEEVSSAPASQETASEQAEELSAEKTSPEAASVEDDVDGELDFNVFVDKEDATEFLAWVFSLNDLEMNEDPGDKLDDPIVAIPVEAGGYPEHPLLRTNIPVKLRRTYGLYIDELSLLASEDPDDDFFDEYHKEVLQIIAIQTILHNLTEMPPSGKADIDSFAQMCGITIDMERGIFDVDASGVAEDLARILEKNGVVKIKGDIIRWKKM